MKRTRRSLFCSPLAALAFAAGMAPAWGRTAEVAATPAQGVTLSIYDTGLALVREARRITLAQGDSVVRFTQLPARLDPATLMLTSAGGPAIELHEQQFAYDLSDVGHMLGRHVGREIGVLTSRGRETGVLVSAPASAADLRAGSPLAIRTADKGTMVFVEPGRLEGLAFPASSGAAFEEPTVLWHVSAPQEGIVNARLNYATDGLSWRAYYELLLEDKGGQGALSGRVGIENRSGGDFRNARVRLIATDQGLGGQPSWKDVDVNAPLAQSDAPLRYGYGRDTLTFEKWLRSPAPLETYELPQALSVESGGAKYVMVYTAPQLPVRRFFVYDGVRFDRFQRNRRNDWNYGTESHNMVEAHLEFDNTKQAGLGFDMVPGRFRLYQRRTDGVVDLLGEDLLSGVREGDTAHVRLGLARGLKGERERTGYSEAVPLHEYEETFEIRLENNSQEEAEIRVVEHLYRWRDFQIARADTEYTQVGPQRIEFRPKLKPGGRRAIHYTVRYTW